VLKQAWNFVQARCALTDGFAQPSPAHLSAVKTLMRYANALSPLAPLRPPAADSCPPVLAERVLPRGTSSNTPGDTAGCLAAARPLAPAGARLPAAAALGGGVKADLEGASESMSPYDISARTGLQHQQNDSRAWDNCPDVMSFVH
jgi:hypothetical protein